jgi:hypothetical protein
MQLSEQSSELETVFKEAKRDLKIFFSFTGQPENIKTICASTKSTELI